MGDIDSFRSSIAAAATKVAKRTMEADREGMARWIQGALTGREQVRSAAGPATSRDERFVAKTLKGFSEISDAMDSMETIAKLARRSPPKSSGVDSAAHLRLLVEAWLHEIYILGERCDVFLTHVSRAYRNDKIAATVKSQVTTLRALVNEALKTVLGVRGAHVHEARYDDFALGRLRTLRILSVGDPVFGRILKQAMRQVRREKIVWLNARNAEARELLNAYFGSLEPIVFVRKGAPRYPGAS